MNTKTLSIRLAIILLMPLSLLTGKTWAETVNVNFIVLALDGTRALTISNQTLTVGEYMYTQFPDEYKSPFLDNGDIHLTGAAQGDYSFYKSEEEAKKRSDQYKTQVESSMEGMTIFVVYQYDVSKSKAKGFLSGGSYTLETYNNKVNNGEWLCYQGTWDQKSTPVTIGTEKYETNTWRSNLLYTKTAYDDTWTDAQKSLYIYTINIEDPYQVTILSHVNTKVSGVNQDREDWYFCGGSNPGDVRLQPTLAGAKTNHIWSYAILPGYNTNPSSSEPDAKTYRIIVTDNYNYNNARSYSNWGSSFTNPNTPDGHYYLNNRGLSTKTCFHLRNGGSADIREGANHRIIARKATRFAFVIKTHVSGKKLTDYVVTDYDSDSNIEMPERMKRKYCSYELFLDSNFQTKVGSGAEYYTTYQKAYEGDETHKGGYSVFYVKYTVSGVPFQFSTEDHPKWYSIRTGTEVKSTPADINASYKYIHYESNSFKDNKTVDDMAAYNTFWFAFVGDPYEVKVINRNAGTNKYMGIAANANTNTKLQAKNGATDQTVWSMVDSEGTPDNQFYLRLYGLDKTPANVVYTSGKELTFNVGAAPLLVEKIAGYDYVYKIVNNSGDVALSYTAKDMLPGEAPLDAMPSHIKSPAAKNYRFYKTMAHAETDLAANRIEWLSDVGAKSGGDIYVRYDTDNLMISKPYDMKVNGKYIYIDGDNIGMAEDASGQPLARRSWVFHGDDPYKIKLRVMNRADKWLTDGTPVAYSSSAGTINYAFLYGNGDADNYALAVADGNKDGAIQYMGRETAGELQLYTGTTHDPETDEVTQIILEDVEAMCTYTVIDNDGNVATQLYEKVKAFPMEIPDKIKSPLAKNYRYYTSLTDARADATTNSRTGMVTSFTYQQFLDGILDVWVRYDNDSSMVKMNAADATTNNPFYTLEFTDQSSPKQYMESSNIPTDNYERPSWSYVNGFGQFYIYGDQLHDEIFSEGKSNRTRFLWYFQGNDPYNLQIMSYQKRSSKNMYFRTYYDNGLDKVVTVLTQKDHKLLHPDSEDVVQNDSVPSNYMILGTLDAAQFTTRDYFGREQHTVEQLEHGWRYAGESAGTDEIEELFAQKNMKAHHLDFDEKHWFTTVQMGKTIQIHEEELVPVLVLVDRHGWRLKYWPFSRRNDDAIKLFNSPMVTNYRWYYDGQVSLTGEEGGTNTISKTTGYYHYVIPQDATPNFESPTLSWTYWNEHKTGTYSSVNINIYVTYDVEGAEGWTSGSTTTPDCLLDKNGILGYTNESGELLSDNYTEAYQRGYYFYPDSLYLNDKEITDEKLWKLELNPNIDAEMGYTEAGLTYTEEQQLFDPYNIRIRTKQSLGETGKEAPYYLAAVYDEESGEIKSVIEMRTNPGTPVATRREDDNIRQITGCTWMYVQDLQGKPRLVPRFDKDYSLTDLSRMQETISMNFPEQWSRITPIKEYDLHIREQGSTTDVLTATIKARAFAGQPIQLKDEHRRHWCEYNEFHTNDTYTDTIKTFPYMADKIYAVFDYSDDAPRFGKTTEDAWWYNMGILGTPRWANGTGPTNVTTIATIPTDDTKWKYLWGFIGNPYSFQVINYDKQYLTNTGTLGAEEGSAASWTTPVGLKDGTTEVPYFKLENENKYLINNSSNQLAVNTTDPTVANNKITLVSKNEAQFIIINNKGEEALAFTAELPAEGLALPLFARSPLVDKTAEGYRDGYKFSTTEPTLISEKYDFTDEQKKGLNYRPLFGETIYVRYAFDNSKSNIDLSGKAMFNIGNLDTGYYLYQSTYNSETSGEWIKKDKESDTSLNGNTYLWYLCGNDPYDIHITNKNIGDDKWLSPQLSSDGKEYVMRLKADGSGAPFNKFILVDGSQTTDDGNCYRLMAAYPTDSRNNKFWYTGRKNSKDATGGRFLKDTDENLATYADLKLIPKTFIMVRYHLTRKVTGETMVSKPVQAVCKSDITLPDGWQRSYCTYTYQTRYKEADQTYSDSYDLVEVEQMPFLTSDTDELPLIDMYVDYTVGTLPFNLIPTANNTKAEIESLDEDIFKLDTYEDRLERGFGSTKTESDPKGYLYFMVMNTNNDFSKGSQYFLQRDKAKGRINYMSNDYALHKNNSKNYKEWSYSRLAEYYRGSKLEPFRDESWLWAFAGDPYDLYVFNVEGVIQKEYDNMEDVTTITYHPRHALNYETLSKTTTTKNNGEEVKTTTYEYVANTVAYKVSDDKFTGYRWGLGLPKGDKSDQTFSLMVNEMDEDGNFVPDGTTTPRYLQYTKSAIDNANELVLTTRADNYKKLDFNIMVLPYEPTRYEDIQLEIRRLDNIFTNMSDVGTGVANTHTSANLVEQTSGISELYYSASTREYAAGDKISGKAENLPVEAVRHFCDYTVYEDVYDVPGGYTVAAGPYVDEENRVFTYVGNVKKYIKKDGSQTDDASQAYQPTDGKPKPGVWPQSLYVSYKVTSDVFLKDHPTKAQVTDMVNNNDHVYFMDFTQNLAEENYKKGRHAYFDNHTFFSKDEKTTLNKEGGSPVLVDVKDSEGNVIKDKNGENVKTVETVYDKNDKLNNKQFNTTTNRMESVPENLKWYFVGDPYKVQVYCTAGDWNKEGELKDGEGKDIAAGTVAANLCRFDPTESRFQYIVDCVHLRVPDTSTKDPRPWLVYYEENATTLKQTGKVVENPNYNKPLYDNFYWEVVPSIKGSGDAGKDYFALRFKRDNVQLKYKGVYYYLAGADKSKKYLDGTYGVNLSYNSDNATYNTGSNKGMHSANDADCVIKLVQPAKVYVSAYKPDDQNLNDYAYPEGERVTNEELSEYFGVGETLSEVPRHLQRKFVEYGMLTNTKTGLDEPTSKNHILAESNATNWETCGNHGDPTTDATLTYYRINKGSYDASDANIRDKRASYKFKVNYRTSDLSNGDGGTVNLFTTQAAFDIGRIQWLDFTVGKDNWPYFDKLKTAKPALISNYRTAVDDKTADGWNDGLKGLHWAFIGDPYDFYIVNRRRYDDNKAAYNWLAGQKTTITDYAGTTPADSVIWLATLANETTATKTSKATAALADGEKNTHWSLQMWKTGSSKDYFLRTASLKTEVVDATVGDYSNDYSDGSGNRNQTNNYWRVVAKNYDNGEAYFEAVPFSLADKGTYSSSKTASNYSNTMVGAGVTENLLDVRTAVAKDEDRADNDCFDAHVRVVSNEGVERIALQQNLEIRYDDVTEALPNALRRYGCKYKCYIDYVDNDNRGTEVKNFDSDVYGSEPEGIVKDSKTFRELVADALAAGTPLTLTYVYTVEDDVAQLFTTETAAKTEDYTWMNTYYQWLQYYSGTNVEIEEIKRTFDHYVYNADGHIIDEIYNEEKITKIVNNPKQPYETKGFLNTHTSLDQVFGDENAQTEDDRQKWALIGDPYGFTMKNYAQYLQNAKATVTLDENGGLLTTNAPSTAKSFALAMNDDGNTYLADINSGETNKGTIDKLVSFAYSITSDKDLKQAKGSGVNTKDPTGNTLNLGYTDLTMNPVGEAKPFFLSNLKRYADIVQYHLVIAHQNTTDHTDVLNEAATKTLNNHLYEFLKYRGIIEKTDSTYFLTYTGKVPSGYKDGANGTTVSGLLKKYGTLRDLVSFPIADRVVGRIGIGNRPSVPWYMKRQFCTYTCYQHDVMRSVVDTESKVYAEVDADWTGKTREIEGVLYKVDPNSPFADAENNYVLFRTFIEDGVEKRAYNIKWVSIFDKSNWTKCQSSDANAYQITSDDVTQWGGGLVKDEYRKTPSGYAEALELQGHELVKMQECHFNRKVIIDVVYQVKPTEFEFARNGRNTTAWYQMMTNNDNDGLMNFSYKDGIGARLDRSEHVTNNYLWAPEGDPYGFVLRSRYATINGTGWDDVAVTTTGHLPKDESDPVETGADKLKATYTGSSNSTSPITFNDKHIIHAKKGDTGVTTDGATNAVYEMFEGDYQNSFLMHPTSAWTDNNDADFMSYYMVHAGTTASLAYRSGLDMRSNADANWRLLTSPEQLWPYFARAGYVGGLDPAKAQSFSNDELYNTLKEYMDNKASGIVTKVPYTTLNKVREVVYSGTFVDKNGVTVTEGTPRSSIALPMLFKPTNLVNMKAGYYRIKAFSEKALDTDGADMKNDGNTTTDDVGIVGPRYISGYRFKSEKNTGTDGIFLHLLETSLQRGNIHTYGQLSTQITAAGNANRNLKPDLTHDSHKAMAGNIEILPADFDPSSIFQFISVSDGDEYGRERYTLKTQGMNVVAKPEAAASAATRMVDSEGLSTFLSANTDFKEKFRVDDIGGTGIALRMRRYEKNAVVGGKKLTTWDDMIAQNLQTNYLCIDPDSRYRVTILHDNEMTEIGDHNNNGLNGIQNTVWLLQPVGVKEEWPYNQMPLRVEVNKGGVKNQALEGDAPTADANQDPYYYGTLYVPFDTRIGRTTDAAFTMVTNPSVDDDSGSGKVTMASVSQHNDMGNPQYVPANMPVVLRTDKPGTFEQKNLDGTTYATRNYIDMYLPYSAPAGVAVNVNENLKGEYLEQQLSNTGLTKDPGASTTNPKVMVFGLPFAAPHDSHEYNTQKQVGFYTNENWAREDAPTANARSATDSERDNRYVFHNKIYYLHNMAAPVRQIHIVALFDGEDEVEFEEDRPIDETVGGENVPWPCDVYDLQGRRVAENETPQTLRKNHPRLRKGVYMFGGHKVVVR